MSATLEHHSIVHELLWLGANDIRALPSRFKDRRPWLIDERARSYVTSCGAISSAWIEKHTYHQYIIYFSTKGSVLPPMRMICPFALTWTSPLKLHINSRLTIEVHIDKLAPAPYAGDIRIANDVTMLLLRSTFGHIMPEEDPHTLIKFEPLIPAAEMKSWLEQYSGQKPVSTWMGAAGELGLIRVINEKRRPYSFEGLAQIISSRADVQTGNATETKHLVKVANWRENTGNLSDVSALVATEEPDTLYLPVERCTVDNLPLAYAQVADLLPSIIQHAEESIVTDDLCDNLLASVRLGKRSLVNLASGQELSYYESLTSLGQSCLKLYTSITLMSQYIRWDEGLLTRARDRLISNECLAMAAQNTGLEWYFQTGRSTDVKQRPEFTRYFLKEGFSQANASRLSTKNLADTVVSLLGAAWLDGGEASLIAVLSIFMPQLPWEPLSRCKAILLKDHTTPTSLSLPAPLTHLETLVKHRFQNMSLLLQAITHPSYQRLEQTPSFERLEFCGDTIVEFLIKSHILRHSASLGPFRMQKLLAALSCSDFLGFVCLNHGISLAEISPPAMSSTVTASPPATGNRLTIWHFMQHSPKEGMTSIQRQTYARFIKLQPEINAAMVRGNSFPWTLLASLAPQKVFSDLVESVAAAIYVDSVDSLQACEDFLVTLGVLPYLDRAIREDLNMIHPKAELIHLGNYAHVHYLVTEFGDSIEEPNYRAKILIDGKLIAVSTGSRSKAEAELKAADIAVSQLKQARKRKVSDEKQNSARKRVMRMSF